MFKMFKRLTQIFPSVFLMTVGSIYSIVLAAEQSDAARATTHPDLITIGWLENVRVYPGGLLMHAKMDTGAKSNAIHAQNIEVMQNSQGDYWVTFDLLEEHEDPNSESLHLRMPLSGEVKVKLRYTSVRDVRPVVDIEFCLNGERYREPFSLTERSDFNYPILLGRTFLAGNFLIDPSETFTHRAGCKREP
jgi:hypothetical protein